MRLLVGVGLGFVALLAVSCFPDVSASPQQAQYIRVGSFNIANFGDRDEYKRSLIALVNIIKEPN